ncbi:CHAD domain-containing protein [Kocuria nitroreducens]|uniref:CHAD domain-containing protein n=1 Tax=Kocuria nitroreducens TaxID=3058914 RepID=UPI0036DD8288
MLHTVLAQLAEQLVLWDLEVHLDAPGAVHRMRVTSRSTRSPFQAAVPFLEGKTARELDARLRGLPRTLSGARNAEVIPELLPSRVDALGGQVDPTAAFPWARDGPADRCDGWPRTPDGRWWVPGHRAESSGSS